MKGREAGWSAFCAFSGALIVYAMRWLLGYWPNPVYVVGMLLVSIGGGLIVARFSRLGPFCGELGSPWAENELRDALLSEVSRATRYVRALSIVAVRGQGGTASWETVVRGVDRAIACRRGWTLLLLPETDASGALTLMRRVGASDITAQAVVVSLPEDVLTGDELVAALLELVQQCTQPGRVLTMRHGHVQTQALAG